MFCIIKICCSDCRRFFDLYICKDIDYKSFIENIDEYYDYTFYIFDFNGKLVDSFDGDSLC